MFKNDIDQICAATLQGRFGPSLMSLCKPGDPTRAWAVATAVTAATSRNVAVWTTARSGSEQGKL